MTDTDRKLFCPACGEEMQKVYINSAKCFVDVCISGCGGIYFDKGELEQMDEFHEQIPELKELFKDKDFMLVDEERARMCPKCSCIMTKKYSSANGEVEIDECSRCGGIFLDCNELFQIRKEFTEDNANPEGAIISLLDEFKSDGKELSQNVFDSVIKSVY